MKKIFALLFAFALLVVFSPPPVQAAPDHDQGQTIVLSSEQTAPAVTVQEEGGGALFGEPNPEELTATPTPIDFLKENWGELLIALFAFAKVIVNLTPTESDNKVFVFLDNLISWIIPNLKKGGGTFKVSPRS